jgi:hypothetical protein
VVRKPQLPTAIVTFAPECQRRENGMIMASNPDSPKGSMQWMDCKSQFDTGFSVIVTDIRERRFEVVDRTKGLTFGWGYFDHDGVFKAVDGKIRQIEAVLTTVPYQMESGW